MGAPRPALARLALRGMWRRGADGCEREQQMDLATWVRAGVCSQQEQLEILLNLDVRFLLSSRFGFQHSPRPPTEGHLCTTLQ